MCIFGVRSRFLDVIYGVRPPNGSPFVVYKRLTYSEEKELIISMIFQVTDWWEEYVYLRGRSPIMVNSNYYGVVSILFFTLMFNSLWFYSSIYTVRYIWMQNFISLLMNWNVATSILQHQMQSKVLTIHSETGVKISLPTCPTWSHFIFTCPGPSIKTLDVIMFLQSCSDK